MNFYLTTFWKASIISGTSFCYDDSESTCSHTELDIDECVEAPEDTSFYSLGVAFILDGEITEKQEDQCDSCQAETMNYQADVKAEETFCVKKMKFQLRMRNVQLLTMVMQLQVQGIKSSMFAISMKCKMKHSRTMKEILMKTLLLRWRTHEQI